MKNLKRITFDPNVMGGMIIGLIAAGHDNKEILKAYPYLEPEDIREALSYAAWRVEEIELPLVVV